MRIKRSMLVVALFQLMLVPRAVSAQEESMCFRCMDYNHCGWVDGGNNTSCTEWPCAYTGKPCGEGDGFDWNANRIEVRDENGVLVQMEEVTSTRFAYWNCEKEFFGWRIDLKMVLSNSWIHRVSIWRLALPKTEAAKPFSFL